MKQQITDSAVKAVLGKTEAVKVKAEQQLLLPAPAFSPLGNVIDSLSISSRVFCFIRTFKEQQLLSPSKPDVFSLFF